MFPLDSWQSLVWLGSSADSMPPLQLSNLGGFLSRPRITITKTYNDNALFEDLKALCIRAGVKGESVTFIFTDAEIKSEASWVSAIWWGVIIMLMQTISLRVIDDYVDICTQYHWSLMWIVCLIVVLFGFNGWIHYILTEMAGDEGCHPTRISSGGWIPRPFNENSHWGTDTMLKT